MVRRKRRAGVLRRSLLLAFGIVLLLIIGIYLFLSVYFKPRPSLPTLSGGGTADAAAKTGVGGRTHPAPNRGAYSV